MQERDWFRRKQREELAALATRTRQQLEEARQQAGVERAELERAHRAAAAKLKAQVRTEGAEDTQPGRRTSKMAARRDEPISGSRTDRTSTTDSSEAQRTC